jgi:hypothetical protein
MEVISRGQARERGLSYYFTGKPCKHGHVSKRRVVNCSCYSCWAIASDIYRKANPEKVRTWEANRDPVKRAISEARYLGSEKSQNTKRAYQSTASYKASVREYHSTDRYRGLQNGYHSTDRVRGQINDNDRSRYQNDQGYRLQKILRARQKAALRGKSRVGSFIRDLGCSVEEVQKYLEAHVNWQPEWSWQNWGGLWELDHIRAVALYDLEDRDQFLAAAHFTNLQPLSIEEHKEKTKEDVRLIRWFKNA